jgi:hypothetical protein
MSNKKRYLLEHDGTYFDMHVDIDHDKVTEKELTGINEFWSESRDRLEAEGGDVLRAVLKLLCQTVIHLQFEYGYNTHGIRELFNYSAAGKGQEGWPKMDGSEGFEIMSVSDTELPSSNITIKEMPAL